jgi:hypothetical protein
MVEQKIYNHCLQQGAYYSQSSKCELELFPKVHDDFAVSVERCSNFLFPERPENRLEVLPMALFSKPSKLTIQYLNKLPIMMMNKKRLTYTTEAFDFKYQNQNAACLATEFILAQDIIHVCDVEFSNERFSKLLHTLKLDGYENYIFALARKLKFNVNLIKSKGLIYEYTNPQHTGWLNCAWKSGEWFVSFSNESFSQSYNSTNF